MSFEKKTIRSAVLRSFAEGFWQWVPWDLRRVRATFLSALMLAGISHPVLSQRPDLLATLPDPLKPLEGFHIESPMQWLTQGRPATLELFREHVYGRTPLENLLGVEFRVIREDQDAIGGIATLKVVEITVKGISGERKIELVIHIPNGFESPVPGYLMICHRARSNIDPNRQTWNEFWPVERIVRRGYAAIAFHTSEVSWDSVGNYLSDVIAIMEEPQVERGPDAWGTIAAWAFGARLAMDYLETDPQINSRRIAVIGHSRGGKAALWAGAEDERFAMVVSNNSGSTGAALARRRTGETVEAINNSFPHWFSTNYKQYNRREDDLPVDQHQLLALMAPRLVYVASGSSDGHADPRGEFLSCVHAEPVYGLFGLAGVGKSVFPDPDEIRHGGHIGYHLRWGGHALNHFDWDQFMNFSDLHWTSSYGWQEDALFRGGCQMMAAPWLFNSRLLSWYYHPGWNAPDTNGWVWLPSRAP